ncbi:hypothetical protein DS745_08295 [Anaerobacillus alkaliphilus]|uniref:Uncharacterized protein n=1 Tax=Anaerobacillus alkaliphilus TaxID=1548597 RepID=A0A4Q0VTW4_9BACI|nr:hypothetical protein [Anaerobacillus alkaliphilus]RXJ02080.1 hypothetical protein DS745_08295 [Anaerobacillus alkaliphilus]
MSGSLMIILAVLIIFVVTALALRGSKNPPEDLKVEKTCKSCMNTIPEGYTKALCPHCSKFLM